MSAGELEDVISAMETDLMQVEGLARAVTVMGDRAASKDVDAGAVYSVGEALETRVEALRHQWDRAFRLSREEPSRVTAPVT